MAVPVVAALLATTAGGQAAWGDASKERDATRRKGREVRAQLDLAKASDAAVETELGRLEKDVAVQQARTAEAHQAEVAALAAVRDATARLAAIDARVRDLRRDLARQAVEAYTDPAGQGGLAAITRSSSLDAAARRQTLLDVVQSNRVTVVEGLRGARQDQADAAATLRAAQQRATERASVEAARARTLRAAQAAKESTHAELTRRIADLQEESRQLASREQELENLIRQRSAALAASRRAPVLPGAVVGSGRSSSAGLIWPVHGPVTSEFGPRWGGFHPGIDIALPTGTPIAAARAGTVVLAGANGGYGNLVVIDHGGGLATAYAHQSRIAVNEGQQVAQGQVVGLVGSTGHSTGPHLHFEVRVDGSPRNPRSYEAGSP